MHKKYTGRPFSGTFASIGSFILMLFLPFLVVSYQNTTTSNSFLSYTPFLSIIFSVSSSLMGSMSIGFIFFTRFRIRDLIYGTIAGAFSGGASSIFTSNIVYAMTAGFTGGAIQVIIHRLI
jgi:hypothetical protein